MTRPVVGEADVTGTHVIAVGHAEVVVEPLRSRQVLPRSSHPQVPLAHNHGVVTLRTVPRNITAQLSQLLI